MFLSTGWMPQRTQQGDCAVAIVKKLASTVLDSLCV